MMRSLCLPQLFAVSLALGATLAGCSEDKDPLMMIPPPPPPPPGPDCTILEPRDARCPPLPPLIDCTRTPTIAQCTPPVEDCSIQPALPVQATTWMGAIHNGREPENHAEVVLDGLGNLYGVDRAGNVFRQTRDGVRTILAAKAVRNARGLAFLSTGELLIADSGLGTLTGVYAGGEVRTLIRHLDFPSGLEVDKDDRIYISEVYTRSIRRFNLATGTSSVVITGLGPAPAALAFSPDEDHLYVTDDVDGVIRVVDRLGGDTFDWPRVFVSNDGPGGGGGPCDGKTEGSTCTINNQVGTCELNFQDVLECRRLQPCEGSRPGDNCRGDFFGIGTCEGDPNFLNCTAPAPCENKRVGQPCISEFGFSTGFCTEVVPGQPLSCQVADSCTSKLPGDDCVDTFGTRGQCVVQPGWDQLFCASLGECFDKEAGDACFFTFGGEGICTDDGFGGLWCMFVDPCAGMIEGDACSSGGRPGTCTSSQFGFLECVVPDGCESLEIGAACTTLTGDDGTCTVPPGSSRATCMALPPCLNRIEGAECRQDGADGLCIDNFDGDLYCQTVQVCDAFEVGDPCRDPNMPASGHCNKNADGKKWCDPVRPCAESSVGDRCFAPYTFGGGICAAGVRSIFCQSAQQGGGGCDTSGVGASCTTPGGDTGTCEEVDGELLCQAGLCSYQKMGGTCSLNGGGTGVCAIDDGDRLCIPTDPCAGRMRGDSCTSGPSAGICSDNGRGGDFCRITTVPCQGAVEGAACFSRETGLGGSCTARAGGGLVCETPAPCGGRMVGEECSGRNDRPGLCEASALGGELICNTGGVRRSPRAIEVDACGWVYVADSRSDAVWRYSSDAREAQLVAKTLHGSITSLMWGSDVGGWKKGALYLGVRGGTTVLELDLGGDVEGRAVPLPTVEPTAGPATPDLSRCIDISAHPIETIELVAPRGYHDVGISSDGYLIGSDGSLLVGVDRQDNVIVYAPVSGAEGFDFLPDGTLVSTSRDGIVTVSPEGAVSPLAPGVYAYGLRVGPDGKVYVGTNQLIYRIDPVTQNLETYLDTQALEDSFGARTIEFDPDHSRMIMGSFGDGVFTMPIDENFNPTAPPKRLATLYTAGPYLDGLAIDECGNAYVPSFSHSALYRISPDGEVSLYRDTELSPYGHGARMGRDVGGWRADALYLPQPYNGNTVVELIIGVGGRP